MRTNIVLDDELIGEAMRITGARTKRQVVDRALRDLVARHRQRELRKLAGRDLVDTDYDVREVGKRMGRRAG